VENCDDENAVTVLFQFYFLFSQDILKDISSAFYGYAQPKYVWSVDSDDEVYEAKIGLGGYHGYRLADEDDIRAVVLKEWRKRCQAD
jgi:hypothetical protein